jgi:hypothetical protein
VLPHGKEAEFDNPILFWHLLANKQKYSAPETNKTLQKARIKPANQERNQQPQTLLIRTRQNPRPTTHTPTLDTQNALRW